MTIESWREVDGDNTLALDWPLDADSHVWEIGGYEGRWAAQIADKFHCYIDIFEPQGWAVEKMRERFRDNPKITIHPYGLWLQNKWLKMGDYFTDGASVMKPADLDHLMEFKDIYHEVMNFEHGIDLCLMNIEGAEWLLINSLQAAGAFIRFKRFWCQFHEFVGDAPRRRHVTYDSIGLTHRLLWDHYPTAVAWERMK